MEEVFTEVEVSGECRRRWTPRLMVSLAVLQATMLKEKQELELEVRSRKEELSRLRAQVARNRFLEDDGRQQTRRRLGLRRHCAR